MRASPLILSLLLLSALTGCSADLSPRASADLAGCRRSADQSMGADAAIDPADDHTANPMVMARREQLRSQYQTMVDQCMGSER